MNPKTLTEPEAAIIKLLRAHPQLAASVTEVLAMVAEPGCGTLDAAEARLAESVQALGLHALGGWEQRAEPAAGERLLADDAGNPPARP